MRKIKAKSGPEEKGDENACRQRRNKNKDQCLPGPGGETLEEELTGQPDCSVELTGLFVP